MSAKQPADVRRRLTLGIAVTLLTISVFAWAYGSSSTTEFATAACARIGLVMGALWLAWPTLKKPAKWLPASAPVIGVVALVVLAAQPRLIIPSIPIVGALITVSALVRAFRGPKSPRR